MTSGIRPGEFEPGDEASEDELGLIAAIEAGRAWWPEPGIAGSARTTTIRAALMRAILVGTEIGGLPRDSGRGVTSRPVAMLRSGLRIQPPPGSMDWIERDLAPRISITGDLVLDGLSAPGGMPLPPLLLEYCAFDGLIDMAGLSVASLSLKGGRFAALRLSDAAIAGPLDLSWCGPYLKARPDGEPKQYDEEELGGLWPFGGATFERDPMTDKLGRVDGRMRTIDDAVTLPDVDRPLPSCVALLDEMRVDGGISFTASRFVRAYRHSCPFRRESHELSSAVRLAGSQIAGSLDWALTVVVGGIMMKGIDVAEDVWFQGSRVFAYGGQDAVDLQSARIGGILAVRSNDHRELERRPEFNARARFGPSLFLGGISGIGMRAHDLWIGDCLLFANTHVPLGESVGGDWGHALTLTDCNIANSVRLGGYNELDVAHSGRVFGTVTLDGTRIGGSFQVNMFGSNVAGEPPLRELLPLGHDFVRTILGYASTYLAEHHTLAMEGVNVGNAMLVSNCQFVALRLPDSKESKRLTSAIDLWKADIGKSLQVRGSTQCKGAIRLNRAKIGRLLAIECTAIEGVALPPEHLRGAERDRWQPTAITADGAEIEGEARVALKLAGSGGVGTIVGALRLDGMRVAGDLDLAHFRLQLPPSPLQAAGTPRTEPPCIVSLEASSISGRLKVDNIGFLNPVRPVTTAASPLPSTNVVAAVLAAAEHVSVRSLPFLHDYVVIRADAGNRFHQILYDRRDDIGVVLRGQSTPIHEANARSGRLDFGTDPVEREARERQYLAFFCDCLQGDEGSFRLVSDIHPSVVDTYPQPEPVDQPGAEAAESPNRDGGGDVNRPNLRDLPIGAFELQRMDEEQSLYFGTILYGDALFTTQLSLSRTGMIEMLDDTPVARMKTKPERDAGETRPAADPDGVAFVSYGIEVDQRTADAIVAAASGTTVEASDPEEREETRHPLATVDLRRMHCGFLADDYGRAWAMDNRLLLRLFGVHCEMVDPTGERHETTLGLVFGAASRTGNRTERRLDWLRLQFAPADPDAQPSGLLRSIRSAVTGWLRDIDLLPRTWSRRLDVDADAFAPQPWDMFAMAHIRAGEAPMGRSLLKDRKDIEARLQADRAHDWLDTIVHLPRLLGGAVTSRRTLTCIVALLAALLMVSPTIAGWVDRADIAALPWLTTSALIAGGVFASALTLWFSPYLAKLSALLFRTGFSYGLSVPRALVTFTLCIVLGAAATHKARTGDWISTGTVWAEKFVEGEAIVAGQRVKRLDPDIALVLATGYSANLPDAPPAIAGRAAPAVPLREPSAPGTVVYALATPCNLGVSSILYAADVFIPVLDLDQEARCSIREEPESDRSYFWWSAAKTIYEILGWIVTSLVILTITGVMRRDMER